MTLPALACELPGARVLFTSREGGVSRGPYASLNLGLLTDDDPAAVSENQRRLAAEVGIPFARFQRGRQVHGRGVRALREPPDPEAEVQDADVQATSAPGVAVQVLTADCLPDRARGRRARSRSSTPAGAGSPTASLEAGVAALRELGARGELRAAIGPGAGGCCYEVGAEVHAALRRRRGPDAATSTGDRRASGCAPAGVAAVHDVGLCTICAEPELFFSHRRDGGVTGRQAGVAWRS